MRRIAFITLFAACTAGQGMNPFDVAGTPIEGPPRTVCQMAKLSSAVLVGRSWVRETDWVSLSNAPPNVPMTRFELDVDEAIVGVAFPSKTTLRVRGGLKNGSNVGAVDTVVDGGRGVWFCTSVDGVFVALEGGLLSERDDAAFYGVRYVDAGVSIADIRTMVNWPNCGTKAYP